MMGAKSKSKVDSVKNETYKKNEDYIVIEDLDVQSTQAIENEFQDEEPKLNGAFISSLIVGANKIELSYTHSSYELMI